MYLDYHNCTYHSLVSTYNIKSSGMLQSMNPLYDNVQGYEFLSLGKY